MKHLLTIDDLNVKDVEEIFCKAQYYLTKTSQCLSGKFVANVFFEHSTRTLTSFEISAKMLGANTINIIPQASAIKKGESISDTFSTLNKIKPDIIVIRSHNSGIPFAIAKKNDSIIINAGDGLNEHPTQALIDAFTIKSLKDKIEGIKVAICGDTLHSRVAHSNIKLLSILGAKINIISPPTLSLNNFSCKVSKFNNIIKGIEDVDVIMVLRLQYERMKGSYVPSKQEYFKIYGIDNEKLSHAKKDVIVMHPGPINRGIEIGSEVADGEKSAIPKQVALGIPIRQSVFDFLVSSI
ncbi:MAG: aspartate carbamoyltransferase catalytic subunit [Rickettsiaceae bacterium H1]|nr:aspartate carbamoyltransferase catalytic subunit [Rickettsiaceae bacterium H1]